VPARKAIGNARITLEIARIVGSMRRRGRRAAILAAIAGMELWRRSQHGKYPQPFIDWKLTVC